MAAPGGCCACRSAARSRACACAALTTSSSAAEQSGRTRQAAHAMSQDSRGPPGLKRCPAGPPNARLTLREVLLGHAQRRRHQHAKPPEGVLRLQGSALVRWRLGGCAAAEDPQRALQPELDPRAIVVVVVVAAGLMVLRARGGAACMYPHGGVRLQLCGVLAGPQQRSARRRGAAVARLSNVEVALAATQGGERTAGVMASMQRAREPGCAAPCAPRRAPAARRR